MRRIILFILPILIIVSSAFTLFGLFQVRFEEEKLIDDLKRKTKSIAESMELAIKHAIKTGDLKSANYLAEKFETRERLQGCVIYNKEGNIIALTKRFSDWKEKDKPYIKDILENKKPRGEIERFKEYLVYSYILPIVDDEDELLGMVEVIHDTSYVFARLTETWKRISLTLIILIAVIFFISIFLYRQIFAVPIQRLTDWFKYFQKGEIDKTHPIKEKGYLGKLASEVEQVALSLRVARRTISDEAEARLQEEIWTEKKLKDFIHAKLGDDALFVVSNREPYMHVLDEITGIPKCIRPASGVVTAIHPILSACGGIWIACGSGDADKKFVNSKNKLGVPPEAKRYILK
ncbi:MAG: hypothetical protein NC925_04360, partial [Candidatus Omnitrophica bacterium]|nr:hypothetical protein [Candidatus Omnitrophota bacterium]